jgi:RNA polymerase sigma factor (sigma-70 family)
MNDWELLQNYVQKRSESAFHTLVERYLALVHSVAMRQVQNSQLADEVAQSVFILLSRKASSLKREILLSGWLFRTTRFVAARAQRAEQRRQRREQEAYDMQQLNTDDESWRWIRPILDEALEQLGATDRNLMLLRFYEGKNHRESGEALGLSEEAARKRGARALDQLRRRFARQGAALPTAALTAALAANAVHAVPIGLAGEVAAAVAGKAILAAIVPTLVQETLSAWRWTKAKVAAFTLAGIATAIFITLAARPSVSAPGATRPAVSLTGGSSNTVVATARPGGSSSASIIPGPIKKAKTTTLKFHVVAKETGKPVAGARLAIVKWVVGAKGPRVETSYDSFTDEDGVCAVSLPRDVGRLDVGVFSAGWAARFATWKPMQDDPLPAEYTLQVDRVTNSIGGWLRDGGGNPVGGAKVWIEFGGIGDAAWRETPRERVGVMFAAPAATSDKDGNWSCAIIPGQNPGFRLEARHPDFATAPVVSWYPDAPQDEKVKQLWAGTLVTTLGRGLEIKGRVTDEAGQTIAGATLEHKPTEDDAIRVKTDTNGDFVIPRLKPETFGFAVSAKGYAPEYRELEVKPGLEPIQISLKPGALLRLQVVTEAGVEVPGVTVSLEEWGEHRHALTWGGKSGSDGRIVWRSAPPEAELELCARKDGWCYTRYIRVKADDEEHKIILVPALNLSGSVTDAGTGVPIETFKVIPGYGEGPANQVWERLGARPGAKGQFKLAFIESRQPWKLRVEAEGYQPFVVERIAPDFSRVLEIALTPAQASDTIRGVVLLPNGTPVAGASVALLTLNYGASLHRSSFQTDGTGTVTNTDPQGNFAFAADPHAHSVAAVSAAGFVKLRVKNFAEPVTLKLQPWARLEGTLAPSERSRQLENMTLMDNACWNYHGALTLDINTFKVKPDSEGRFVFDRVPAGFFSLYINRKMGTPMSCQTDVELRPGETTQATVGGSGRTVTGRFVEEGSGPVVWNKFGPSANLNKKKTVDDKLPKPPSLNKDESELWAVDFWQSAEARKYLRRNRGYGVTVAADDSFAAENVPPGTYDLMAFARRGSLTKEVNIPEGGDEPFDLGVLEITNPHQAASVEKIGN